MPVHWALEEEPFLVLWAAFKKVCFCIFSTGLLFSKKRKAWVKKKKNGLRKVGVFGVLHLVLSEVIVGV